MVSLEVGELMTRGSVAGLDFQNALEGGTGGFQVAVFEGFLSGGVELPDLCGVFVRVGGDMAASESYGHHGDDVFFHCSWDCGLVKL